jgi:hypothetical protein
MRRIAVVVVTVAGGLAAPAPMLEPARLAPEAAGRTDPCAQVTGCYTAAPAPAFDGWRIDVTIEPSAVGPIRVSVGRARRARANDARPWFRHELVLENRGPRTVTFADTRTSAIIGPPERRALLAADEGCGYALATPTSPIEPGACALYLDILTLRPQRAARRTVTLFKGLRGLDRLAPGTYVFRKPIRFQAGRKPPKHGAGRTAVLRIVYELDRAAPSGGRTATWAGASPRP